MRNFPPRKRGSENRIFMESMAAMKRALSVVLPVLFLCSCARGNVQENEIPSSADAEEREYVTDEEVYRQALDLLCYGESDYRQNAAAKQLLEIIGGYEDSEKYLSQIYPVCTKITGRTITEFTYDEYGHVLTEKGNPYYVKDEDGNVTAGIGYEYADGLIVRETYPNGDSFVFDYDDNGRIIQEERRYAGEEPVICSYEYELDPDGKILKRTGYIDGEEAGVQTSEYRTDTNGTLTVIQHDIVPQRSPAEKMRLLLFDKEGKLVRVENESGSIVYSYEYVWLPEHDPEEEFVYEHRIRESYI